MNGEDVLRLLMALENPGFDAEIFSALSTENRLQTFHLLYKGWSPAEITEELGLSRSALQPYMNDFRETGLIKSVGKKYVFTEKGEAVHDVVVQVDQMHNDLSELQQFLIENPEVVPEQVLEEIDRYREEDEE